MGFSTRGQGSVPRFSEHRLFEPMRTRSHVGRCMTGQSNVSSPIGRGSTSLSTGRKQARALHADGGAFSLKRERLA